MKKIKQLLGITMVSTAFVGLFIMTMQEYGAIGALKGWLIASGLVVLIWVGIRLVFGEDK